MEHHLLFSTRYGSHLFGNHRPDSDTDWKHIVLPPISSLLLGETPRNVVVKTNVTEGVRNTRQDVDIEYIPLHVFARDFLSGQTYALELAYAVEYTAADQQIHEPRFVEFCRELRARFLTNNIYAMSRYCAGMAELYEDKAERMRAAEAVYAVLHKFPKEAKIEDFVEPFESEMREVATRFPKYVAITTYERDKKGTLAPCLDLLGRSLHYTGTFYYWGGVVAGLILKYGKRTREIASDGKRDWRAMTHAVRIVHEGIELMRGNDLVFPFEATYCDYLRSIRRGEHSYEDITQVIVEGLEELTRLANVSLLPSASPELSRELEVWLLGWLVKLYAPECGWLVAV